MSWCTLSLLVGIFIILTKFLDCHSTAVRLRHYSRERNRLARRLITRYGPRKVIWGTFVLTIMVAGFSILALYLWLDHWYWHLQFAIGGGMVSLIQLAVAHHNYTGRSNRITRTLGRMALYRS